MQPRLSIIIVSWNSLHFLQPCLASLTEVLERSDVELVWVDNGSADGAEQWVTANYPEVAVRRLPENRGVAAARNVGASAARGRYLLFLDDDTEASAEAIDCLLCYAESHPAAGIVACALHDADGRTQQSFKSYPGLLSKIANVLSSRLRSEHQVELPDAPIEPCYVIGACQLIPRRLFERLGGFDEHIFYGPEDADFCMRARREGFATVFLPDVAILHHWRRITNRSLLSPIARRHFAALIYFWRKHRRL